MSKNNKSLRFRKVGRGSVILITGLLMSSGALRFFSSVALAQDLIGQPGIEAQQDDAAQFTISTTGPKDRTGMNRLLNALQEREARVEAQERSLQMRIKALSVTDAEVKQRIAAMVEAEEALRRTLSLADGAAENDIANLITVYENMKPKDAATLFQVMEPTFAAEFLARMRPDITAGIMTSLPPDVAYSISAIIAGRNAAVPKI